MHLHHHHWCISTTTGGVRGASLWKGLRVIEVISCSALPRVVHWLIQIIIRLKEFQGLISGASTANIDWSNYNLWFWNEATSCVLSSCLHCDSELWRGFVATNCNENSRTIANCDGELWRGIVTRNSSESTELATVGICNCHLYTTNKLKMILRCKRMQSNIFEPDLTLSRDFAR